MKYAIQTMINTIDGAQINYASEILPRDWTPDSRRAVKFNTLLEAQSVVRPDMGETIVLCPDESDGRTLTIAPTADGQPRRFTKWG